MNEDDKKFDELWRQHLLKREEALRKERAALNKSDPKYTAKVIALSREEKELEAGFKAYTENALTRIKLDNEVYAISVDQEAQKAKADNEADKIATEERIEQAKLEHEKKALRWKLVIDFGALLVSIVGLIHAFMDLFHRDENIKRISKFEEDDAILSLSDKTVVQDALRDPRRSFTNR